MSISQASVGDIGYGFGYSASNAGASGPGNVVGTDASIRGASISSGGGGAVATAGGPGDGRATPSLTPGGGATGPSGLGSWVFPRPSIDGSVAGSSTSRPAREPHPLSRQTNAQTPSQAQPYSQRSQQYQSSRPQHATKLSNQFPSSTGFADPQTPSEYALNVLMTRFIAIANDRLANTMNKSVDAEPLIAAYLSSRVDGTFESLIKSLGQVARKHAKAVIDSLIRWRNSVLESEARRDGSATSAFQTMTTGAHLAARPTPAHLQRRKAHVATYLLTYTLEGIARILASSMSGSRIALSERDANTFETFAFDTLKVCSRELGANAVQDPNVAQLTLASNTHSEPLLKLCFESASRLLGELSKMRFTSVADRFVSAIEAYQKAGCPKEAELQLENLIVGSGHLHVTVFPMELFEEGAEFIDTLSKFFVSSAVNANVRLRLALTDTFVHLMLPVAGLASAEINHPAWIKAVDTILPRALQMAAKPKYWTYAYPLQVTLMAVSTSDRFLTNWTSCIDAGTSKLKDRSTRVPVLHAASKLLWVYLNRCHESNTLTVRRLESFFRLWFPANRKSVTCADVSIEMHIRMVHYVLFRQFDYGRDLVLDLLRDPILNDGRSLALNAELLSPVRMSIAIHALVRALDCHVKQKPAAFPAGSNLYIIDQETSTEDQAEGTSSSLGDDLPADFKYPRQDVEDAQARFNTLIGKIALICDAVVGDLTVLDDRVSVLKGAAATTGTLAGERTQLERDGFVVHAHSPLKLIVAVSADQQPTLDLLRACIDSWPRCLSPAVAMQSVLSILNRALISADPRLARSAADALRRLARQRAGSAFQVVATLMRWVFRPQVILWEVHAHQHLILPKIEAVLKIWIAAIEQWVEELLMAGAGSQDGSTQGKVKGAGMERVSAWTVVDEIEANALILLSSTWRPLRVLGVRTLRLVLSLDDALARNPQSEQANPPAHKASSKPLAHLDEAVRIITLLDSPCTGFCEADSPLLGDSQRAYLERIKATPHPEPLAFLAQSDDPLEASLWEQIYPGVLRECLERFPSAVAMFRTTLTGRILSMDQHVMFAVGWAASRTPSTPSVNKTPTAPLSAADQGLLASHWRGYITALCSTTSASESSRGTEYTETSNGRTSSAVERVLSARDLFHKLEPFLASEYSTFRDGAVLALGNINADLFPILLEAMHSVSARITDEFRGRGPGKSGSKRNRRNERIRVGVGQILFLTSANLAKVGALSDQKVIQIILAWVEGTFAFLIDREIKDDWTFQQLRRNFAGVVEAFFDGLARVGDTERYFTFEYRFRLFQLFREWNSYSEVSGDGPAKLANMLARTGEQYRDEWQRKQAVSTLLSETQALAYQAACTMAALCQGAISLVGSAVPAPMSGSTLDARSLLAWLSRLFNSSSSRKHAVARRALRGLLLHNASHHELISLVIDFAVSEADSMGADRSFFTVMTETMLVRSSFKVPIAQAACLAFLKLGHTHRTVREMALRLLHMLLPAITDDEFASTAMGSLSQMAALHQKAQINLVVLTCQRVPSLEAAFVSELALRLPSMPAVKRQACLQLLPHVLSNVDLLKGVDGSSLTPFVTGFLTNLSFITMRFGDAFQAEVDNLWTALVSGEALLTNADAIAKFLVEQSLKTRTAEFVTLAKRVLACIFTLEIGLYLFDEICKLIEPTAMIPIPRERGTTTADLLDFYVADLHGEAQGSGRHLVFSIGQVALLLVGELNQGRSAQLRRHLPVLIHAAVTQVDSHLEYVRVQAMSILDQLVRALAPPQHFYAKLGNGKDEAPRWWTFDAEVDDGDDRIPDTMRARVDDLLQPLCDFVPDLREQWGGVAHFWATQGPVRHLAIRSLQVFRVLMPAVNARMLVDMLARLSNTASDPEQDIQNFTLELLYTLRSIVKATPDTEGDLLAHVYWATVACLSTSVESEFLAAIRLFDALMDKLDLTQQTTQDMLLSKKPEDWEGDTAGLQKLVMRGLRSSVTYTATVAILDRITTVHSNTVVDTSTGRLAYVFGAVLPLFMNKMEDPSADHALAERLAVSVGRLADFLGKKDISRICDSVSKNRFRTKDDLTRQGVMCLRAHYLPHLGPDLAILMIGLCLNNTVWLRKQSLRLIRVYLQNIDTQDSSFSKLGLELLMPILQLLSTPLAPEALDVLEEPLAINGGLASQQVLRMSLQWSKMNQTNDHALDTAIFGAPQESGWSVARPQEASLRTRINIQAVFKQTELTLDVPLLSSNVNFVTDDYYDGDGEGSVVQEDASVNNDRADSASVNELVNQLHDLSTFFVDETSSARGGPGGGSEATAAAISTPTTATTPTTTSMTAVSKNSGGHGKTSSRATGASSTLSDVASQWGVPHSAPPELSALSYSQQQVQQQLIQQPQAQSPSQSPRISSPLTPTLPQHQQHQQPQHQRPPRPAPPPPLLSQAQLPPSSLGEQQGSIEKVARILARSTHSKQLSQHSNGTGTGTGTGGGGGGGTGLGIGGVLSSSPTAMMTIMGGAGRASNESDRGDATATTHVRPYHAV